MIIDLITNSEDIFRFVKDKEGGREVKVKYEFYMLVNVPIGYADAFYKELQKFIKDNKIEVERYVCRIMDIRGRRILKN